MVPSYLSFSIAFESPTINRYFGNPHSDVSIWLLNLLDADNRPGTHWQCHYRGCGHTGFLDFVPTTFCIPNSSNIYLWLQHHEHKRSQANCSLRTTISKLRSEHQANCSLRTGTSKLRSEHQANCSLRTSTSKLRSKHQASNSK